VEAINAPWRAGDRAGAGEKVSNAMTDERAVFGSAVPCRGCLARWIDAGMNLPMVFSFSPDTAYKACLQSTLAALREAV
jgi:hypothetical protein